MQHIGHIKATSATHTSKTWDNKNAALQFKGEHLMAIGTILNDGNGYEQLVRVEFKVIEMVTTTTNQNNAALVSTPKGAKRSAVTVPVTVSYKKARRY